MTISSRNKLLLLPALLAVLSACGGGGSNNNSASAPPMMPEPPAPAQTDYNQFVQELFSMTADNTDPVDVNALDFVFTDQDNAAAFDDLL